MMPSTRPYPDRLTRLVDDGAAPPGHRYVWWPDLEVFRPGA
jgi:hypothetical protein